MNCEEASGVGNYATFKSDPNSNNFINSLTKQPQQGKCDYCIRQMQNRK